MNVLLDSDQRMSVGATVSVEGTPVPPVEIEGSPKAFPIEVSRTAIETRVSDLLETPHVIVVCASDLAMDEVIACGNVGGADDADAGHAHAG